MPSNSRQTQRLSQAIKHKALELGLDACGISRAEALDVEAARLKSWLSRGNHASMSWMENHLDKRTDPTKLVDGARSVVSVLQSYFYPDEPSDEPDVGRISRYAWGDDYHLVLKERLASLYEWLQGEVGDVSGRMFVDSAPIMDKAWAARAGLGWIGKHTNLISPQHGSWFFIGELVLDIELSPDEPILDQCGSCTACLDACPTAAITEPYVVDANLCISYTTIEHHEDDVDRSIRDNHGNWIFGCDICQEVCPWNKFRTESSEARYAPRPGILETPIAEWAELDQESFSSRFRKSAIKRTKISGFERNVRYAMDNALRQDGSRG